MSMLLSADLAVAGHTLNPAFNRDTTAYTLALPFAEDSIALTAAAEDPKALLLIVSVPGSADPDTWVAVKVLDETATLAGGLIILWIQRGGWNPRGRKTV